MSASTSHASTWRRVQALLRSQFFLFLLVGGTAAAVNFLSRIVVNNWLGYGWSVAIAFGFGVVTAFVLNRLFVFKGSTQSIHHQATWFVVVNLFGFLQTLAVSLLLAEYAFPAWGFNWHAEAIAHMIGIVLPLISSYFGHKYLSFRH
ncbi:MAG: GtrA family protein [Luteibacter sp.]|uniref:GtrA family protein n=1 Tax=Luteibacter sp. TaxID=1886636 RepID=UPI0028075676|nr:GtrA family protein [Luteibacter sp.]MDQ7996434.1 GtrA family protein [Luteibacter sp.]MDQ8047938.1 GtrA family protein [Luteibacter sp.]